MILNRYYFIGSTIDLSGNATVINALKETFFTRFKARTTPRAQAN